ELPLAFEQRGFINVVEDIFQWNVVCHSRTKERRRWNWHVGANIRAYGVRRIAGNLCGPRSRGFTNAELCFLADQFFGSFNAFTKWQAGSLRTARRMGALLGFVIAVSGHYLVHCMQTGE